MITLPAGAVYECYQSEIGANNIHYPIGIPVQLFLLESMQVETTSFTCFSNRNLAAYILPDKYAALTTTGNKVIWIDKRSVEPCYIFS